MRVQKILAGYEDFGPPGEESRNIQVDRKNFAKEAGFDRLQTGNPRESL